MIEPWPQSVDQCGRGEGEWVRQGKPSASCPRSPKGLPTRRLAAAAFRMDALACGHGHGQRTLHVRNLAISVRTNSGLEGQADNRMQLGGRPDSDRGRDGPRASIQQTAHI